MRWLVFTSLFLFYEWGSWDSKCFETCLRTHSKGEPSLTQTQVLDSRARLLDSPSFRAPLLLVPGSHSSFRKTGTCQRLSFFCVHFPVPLVGMWAGTDRSSPEGPWQLFLVVGIWGKPHVELRPQRVWAWERVRCPGRGVLTCAWGALGQLVSDHTTAELVYRLRYKSLGIVDLLLSPISCY